jgi:alpha-1,3-rhamnosyl/mannosyltransferase
VRVIVNQLPALMRKTGIGHYAAELVRCLRRQAGEGPIRTFPQDWLGHAPRLWDRLRSRLEPTAGEPGAGPRRSGTVLGSLRKTALQCLRRGGRHLIGLYFQASCRGGRYDLYHETNFIPLPSDLPTVTTLHDLSVVLHPEWHPAHRVAYFERHFHRGLARCAHFLTVSEFGRQEVIRTLNIAPERVTRTYNGIRPGLGPLPLEEVADGLRRLGLPPAYLLYLGTIEPRKNVLMLLRAYCALPGPLRQRCPLLLVGGWGWNAGDVAAYFHGEARHRGVLHLGYFPEESLPVVYNGARALAYPSWYEGFGLPPVEMMACGGAVLASTAGAVAETVGSSAHLIDPADLEGWRAALARVIQDDDWRETLRRGATEVARPFTWDRCAADTLRVYEKLCGHGTQAGGPGRQAA